MSSHNILAILEKCLCLKWNGETRRVFQAARDVKRISIVELGLGLAILLKLSIHVKTILPTNKKSSHPQNLIALVPTSNHINEVTELGLEIESMELTYWSLWLLGMAQVITSIHLYIVADKLFRKCCISWLFLQILHCLILLLSGLWTKPSLAVQLFVAVYTMYKSIIIGIVLLFFNEMQIRANITHLYNPTETQELRFRHQSHGQYFDFTQYFVPLSYSLDEIVFQNPNLRMILNRDTEAVSYNCSPSTNIDYIGPRTTPVTDSSDGTSGEVNDSSLCATAGSQSGSAKSVTLSSEAEPDSERH